MYRVYTQKRGIEFRFGVKEKILIGFGIAALTLFVIYFEKILEVMIAGF